MRKYFEPVLFGSIGVLSFAPFSFKYALVISYTYLIYKLFKSKDNRNLNNLFLWSFGYWAIGTSWIIVSIYYYGNVSFIGSVSLFLILSIGCIIFFFLPILLLKRVIINKSNNLLLLAPFVLILVELGRYYFLGGFPWLLPGYIFLDTPYENLYGLIGVSGLSLLLYFFVTANVALYSNKTFLLAFNSFLLISFFIPNIFENNISDEDVINFAIIQPSTDPFTKFDDNYLNDIEDEFIGSSSQAAEIADILVWPEAPLPYTSESIRSQNLIKSIEKPLVTGFFSYQEGNLYNSIINSEQEIKYNKRKLVPFGEYIPFESLLRGLIAFFDMPMSNITQGDAPQQMNVGYGNFSPLVCFDIVFGDMVRKDVKSSNYIINVSNDTWFGNSFGPYQHLEISRIRSVENNIPIIRATNDGISALIDNKGTIVDYMGKGTSGILHAKLVPTDVRTFYNQYGNLLLYLYLLIVSIKIFFVRMKNV
ncbi:MAG: apolipoprotein N-acyltransferase [Gammaproteobacteria bacterium]